MIRIENKSLTVPFAFDEVKGIFTGYASVFNEVDRVNDTVAFGAYDKAIRDFTSGKNKIRINFEHDKSKVLAENLTKMSVDEKGLLVEWKFSEEAKVKYPDIWKWAVEKAKANQLFMSIGFYPEKTKLGDMRDKLKDKYLAADTLYQVGLDHIAITANPVDTKAAILEVKGLRTPEYPIDLSSSWDVQEANRRWREYTKSTESPSADYEKGFMYVEDDKKELFGGYHFQVVDVVDGKPVINQQAVITAHAYLKGARRGVKILNASQKVRALQIIQNIYDKINVAREEAGIEKLPNIEIKSEMSLNDTILTIDGKVTAKKFLKANKEELSNTNIENFVDHLFRLFSSFEKKENETSVEKSQCEQSAYVSVGQKSSSDNLDIESVLAQAGNLINQKYK